MFKPFRAQILLPNPAQGELEYFNCIVFEAPAAAHLMCVVDDSRLPEQHGAIHSEPVTAYRLDSKQVCQMGVRANAA